MNKRLMWISLLILVVALSGCKTTGSAKGKGKGYAEPSTPEQYFETALSKNDFSKAEKVWLKNQDHFLGDPEALAEIEKAVSSFTLTYGPKLTAASTTLDSVMWPSPQPQWALIRHKLSNAQKMADIFDSNTFFADLNSIPPELAALKAKLESKEKPIRDDAAKHFQEYPLLTESDFFAIYPVEIDKKDFLKSQADFLEKKVENATGTGVPHLLKIYGESLPEASVQAMEKRYFSNILRRESGNKAPSFRAIIKAVNETKKIGFPVKEIPDCKIAFVRMTSKSMLKEHGIEFGLGFDVDMPVKADQVKSGSIFGPKTAPDADIVILINETVSKLDRKTFKPTSYSSKFVSGYKDVFNPDFDKIRIVAEQHRLKRDELTARAHQLVASGGIFGAAFGIPIAQEADQEDLKYKAAMTNATNIPRMIEKPIYQNYNYNVVPLQATKLASVQYIVVDRRAKTYFSDVFNVSQAHNFKAIYGVREEDPDKTQIMANFESDQDIRNWEKQPVGIKLSSLLGYYLDHKEKDKKYKKVAEIQKIIMNNRNQALEEFYANKYNSDTGNDPRFDSTVVVFKYDGGLGSGFYVTDDIILTNHHVVEGADYAEIKLHNKMESFGKVIAIDMYRDLALIKVGVRGKPVRFYRDNSIPAGVTLEAIGHPKGYNFTITRGIFSAYRNLASHHLQAKGKKIRYIQTDASINPGNSGGPLFYKDKVVGVNAWKRVDHGVSNLSFAVHYSEVLNFLKQYGIKYRI